MITRWIWGTQKVSIFNPKDGSLSLKQLNQTSFRSNFAASSTALVIQFRVNFSLPSDKDRLTLPNLTLNHLIRMLFCFKSSNQNAVHIKPQIWTVSKTEIKIHFYPFQKNKFRKNNSITQKHPNKRSCNNWLNTKQKSKNKAENLYNHMNNWSSPKKSGSKAQNEQPAASFRKQKDNFNTDSPKIEYILYTELQSTKKTQILASPFLNFTVPPVDRFSFLAV